VLYYIDTSVLLENTPFVKFTRNYIRDPSGVFSISSLVKILMTSLISCLTLKLYLNLLVYDRNIFGSSSKVFGNLWKFPENVRKRSRGLRTTFGESSEIFKNCHFPLFHGCLCKRSDGFVYIMERKLHGGLKV
jgi:hypothetical protein